MDFAISLDAPFKLDFAFSPRLAANAAPAAICCFFDFAGIPADRRILHDRIYQLIGYSIANPVDARHTQIRWNWGR
jgi:hypothetical protein